MYFWIYIFDVCNTVGHLIYLSIILLGNGCVVSLISPLNCHNHDYASDCIGTLYQLWVRGHQEWWVKGHQEWWVKGHQEWWVKGHSGFTHI